MPQLNEASHEDEWVEPDDVPRPIVTYGFASASLDELELAPHEHRKSQILLVQRGALSCEVQSGIWLVPPGSALWIPGGATHSIRISGAIEGYSAFIAPTISPALPTTCCVVSVTSLMREILYRAATFPLLYEQGGAYDRVLGVLLDELAQASVENLHLPMPTDSRLRKIVGLMMAQPADRRALDDWASEAGMSTRTLGRAINRETGMSFGRWRQQLAVVLAVQRLSEGASIKQVASDLGYESVPSFVTMFRKTLGTSPGRYMAERHSGNSGQAV